MRTLSTRIATTAVMALMLAVAASPSLAAQNTAATPAVTFPMARHDEFVAVAKKGDIECLLMGDSITDWWRRGGLPVYEKYFAEYKCANFGIAGDRTQGVLWRMENGELDGYTPKLMTLMIGTNNLGGGRAGRVGNTNEEIAEGITAIVGKFRTKFPQAKVLLLGIFPRGASADAPQRERIKAINAIIAKLHDGKSVRYLDIGSKFLEPDGSISTAVMADGLHPSARGYEIWADAMMPTFKEMMEGK